MAGGAVRSEPPVLIPPAPATILAIDLGTRLGMAYGPPGERPQTESWNLKARGEPAAIASGNLLHLIHRRFVCDKPALVVKAARMALSGYQKAQNSQRGVESAYGFHAIIEALCTVHRVTYVDIHEATVRKHFIGRGTGKRADLKAAVVERCWLLGLMPRSVYDEDIADAIAVFDWAAANFSGRAVSIQKLYLWGEM